MTTKRIGFLMDPIESISFKKDSTLEMMWQAQQMGWQLEYFLQADCYVDNGAPRARSKGIKVAMNSKKWFEFTHEDDIALGDLDVIMMRKDPPFDMEFVYTTYLLELAENLGSLIVNKPNALRDCNEKMYTQWFPELTPKSLITRNEQDIRGFLKTHEDIIVKPLDGMGGTSIFRLQKHDPNIGVVIETMTDYGKQFTLCQKYIPEISQGDKRILMINGEPVDFCLARIPSQGETRGNLAAGGRGVSKPLSERDREICKIVGPELVKRGIIFAGLDVIGDYLTEINVTSPTCIRELNEQNNLNIAGILISAIEQALLIKSQKS